MNTGPFPRELIRASAGTGKTFQLSNRIIGLLAEGVAPDRVLASTFTRKAAGEILDRVLSRLADAALDDDAARRLGEHALLDGRRDQGLDREDALAILGRLSRRLHRIDVGTLDALFVRMARSFALELGLPPRWSIADDAVRDRLRSEAVRAVLEDGDPGELVELLRMSTGGRADRRVHDRLVDEVDTLHGHALELDPRAEDPWSPFRDRERRDDHGASCRALAERLSKVDPPQNKSGGPNKPWVSALERAARALRERDWESFWSKGPPAKFLAGERTYSRKEFPPGLEDLLEEIRSRAAADLAGDFDREARALGRIARRYHRALRSEQRRAGAYGFRDVSHLLGGPKPVASREDLDHRLDRRCEHVLLDEFQDTSTPQWRALRPLVDRVAREPAQDRSIVVVADAKQSIYGWRGADPEIVDRVGRRYDLELDSLRHSWRSSPVVISFVNRVFEGITRNPVLEAVDDGAEVAAAWAETFEEHRAAPPLQDRPGRVTVEVGPDDGRRADRPKLMARAAKRVADLHRDAPGAEIGVLVRRNRTVARLIHELRARGVEASEEGGTSVDDAAPVAAVLALLRLADHPGHSIARYQVAASPLGQVVGLTDHRDDRAARALAGRVRTLLLQDGYGPTLTAWVEELAPHANRGELRRLEQMVELGFRWEDRATLRPADFARYVESETVEDPLSTPVRVMTVHQAKGLEFDVVVLPELEDSLDTGRVETALPERDPETGLVRRVFPAVPSNLRPLFPEMETALHQLRIASIRDELSWLYVAVTRARHALHLIVASGDGSSSASSFARLIRAAVGLHGEPAPEGEVLYETGDPGWHGSVEGMRVGVERSEPGELELRVDAGAPRRRILGRKSPSDLASEGRVDPERLLRIRTPDVLRRGEIVHRWCEGIRWIEDGPPDAEALRSAGRSVAPQTPPAELDRLVRAFLGWIEQDAIREVLSRRSTAARLRDRLGLPAPPDLELERERPFAHRMEEEVVSGAIDRLVLALSGDGRLVGAEVLDFKTDPLEAGDAEGLTDRVGAYTPQLEAYRSAAARLHGLEPARVDARLVFLDPGVVCDV